MKAYCLIRKEPQYRHDAFVAGLAAAGYSVQLGYPGWPPSPGDVMVIWNRYGDTERIADKFEADGGVVLVAENGYLGPGGVSPHDKEPRSIYAIARHAHNGRGQWHVGGPERFEALGVELKPWREDGAHVLVCANRSFGMKGGVMPHDWATAIAGELKSVTKRRIVIRNHPGNYAAKKSLAEDLENAWACVIWSSSCGVQALAAGIPVFADAPWWICRTATLGLNTGLLGLIDGRTQWHALDRYRRESMHALAWAQWHVDEIAAGEPFRYLLAGSDAAAAAA